MLRDLKYEFITFLWKEMWLLMVKSILQQTLFTLLKRISLLKTLANKRTSILRAISLFLSPLACNEPDSPFSMGVNERIFL